MQYNRYKPGYAATIRPCFDYAGLALPKTLSPGDFHTYMRDASGNRRAWDHDHPEVYRTADNKILVVFSNYGVATHPALGMTITKPLYYCGAESYMRLFDSPKHMRQVFKAALTAK